MALTPPRERGPRPSGRDGATAADARGVSANGAAREGASFLNLPLGFEANAGQYDPRVKFAARGDGGEGRKVRGV